mmetsp:Transcript_2550/g.7578  ORF Transcript_2550/g.7578 Transcript_2550/m.7578 type:complete len:213 (-) Transcript_2550:182-820(-)
MFTLGSFSLSVWCQLLKALTCRVTCFGTFPPRCLQPEIVERMFHGRLAPQRQFAFQEFSLKVQQRRILQVQQGLIRGGHNRPVPRALFVHRSFPRGKISESKKIGQRWRRRCLSGRTRLSGRRQPSGFGCLRLAQRRAHGTLLQQSMRSDLLPTGRRIVHEVQRIIRALGVHRHLPRVTERAHHLKHTRWRQILMQRDRVPRLDSVVRHLVH